MNDTYLERWGTITWPCTEVKGEDDVYSTLGPQDYWIRRIKGETSVYHVQMFHIGRVHLKYTIEVI